MPRKPHRYQQIDERLNRMSAVLDGLIARSAERVRQGAEWSRGGREVADWLEVFTDGLMQLPPHLGIRLSGVGRNCWRVLNREKLTIDLLAVGRRTRSRATVVAAIRVAVELLRSDITWVVAKLPRFFDFFPEYRGYELVAGVAGMAFDGTVAKHAERQGLMVFGPGDEVARLLNRPDFRPKVWS